MHLSVYTFEAVMDFLINTEWQFIVSTSISIISIGIGIWIAFRRPVQIPISYEAIAIELTDGSENEVKELIEKMQMLDDDRTIKYPCFVTFKIWNSGRESITLSDDSKPLTIAFKRGERILDCQKLVSVPDDIELNYKFLFEKILLRIPLLDPKESITFRVLLTNYVNYFPAIYVRVPGKKRIVRANNIRRSKEMKFVAIAYAVISVYMFISFKLFSHNHNSTAELYIMFPIVLFFLSSILFYLMSWADRRMPPYPNSFMLPSTWLYIYLIIFVLMVPVLIIIGVLAAIVYALFGPETLSSLYLLAIGLFTPIGLWNLLYIAATGWLRKRKKSIMLFKSEY